MQTTFLTKQHLNETEFIEFIDFFKRNPTNELYVLPHFLKKTKLYLANTDIGVGVLIDYPNGCGTLRKVAFEVGEMLKNSPDKLMISISNTFLKEEKWDDLFQLISVLKRMSFVKHNMSFIIDLRHLKEMTILKFAQKIKQSQMDCLCVIANDALEAKHLETIFYFDSHLYQTQFIIADKKNHPLLESMNIITILE